jgi:hypothetical protein
MSPSLRTHEYEIYIRSPHAPRELDGLAVVERLELGELLRVALDEARELVHQPRSLGAGHALPRRGRERAARGGDRAVDVLRGRCGGRRRAIGGSGAGAYTGHDLRAR